MLRFDSVEAECFFLWKSATIKLTSSARSLTLCPSTLGFFLKTSISPLNGDREIGKENREIRGRNQSDRKLRWTSSHLSLLLRRTMALSWPDPARKIVERREKWSVGTSGTVHSGKTLTVSSSASKSEANFDTKAWPSSVDKNSSAASLEPNMPLKTLPMVNPIIPAAFNGSLATMWPCCWGIFVRHWRGKSVSFRGWRYRSCCTAIWTWAVLTEIGAAETKVVAAKANGRAKTLNCILKIRKFGVLREWSWDLKRKWRFESRPATSWERRRRRRMEMNVKLREKPKDSEKYCLLIPFSSLFGLSPKIFYWGVGGRRSGFEPSRTWSRPGTFFPDDFHSRSWIQEQSLESGKAKRLGRRQSFWGKEQRRHGSVRQTFACMSRFDVSRGDIQIFKRHAEISFPINRGKT